VTLLVRNLFRVRLSYLLLIRSLCPGNGDINRLMTTMMIMMMTACARWSPGMRGSGSSEGGGLSDFIDGLGPGQLVGRQLLGAPTLGDVQLSMCYQKGFLEVSSISSMPNLSFSLFGYFVVYPCSLSLWCGVRDRKE
jgi:hypothetical protein